MLGALALALALSAPPRAQPAFVAVVDPGHGGEHDGAFSPDGVPEKRIALEIARKVVALLKKQGGRVILTRTGDVSVQLQDRSLIANGEQADLFISIHLNSMPTRAKRLGTRGIETFFLSADATDASASAVAARENADLLAGVPGGDGADPVKGILNDLEYTASLDDSSRLAYAIHERLVKAAGAEDRGVKQAPFYVLAGARMPSVLLELGFISHPEESRKLRSPAYQEILARAVADGVKVWRTVPQAALR
ncbi:MAG TPA: N-acetylmuramoyl-L-alanine amidase [Anaeromyxobacteraceae bacterium]|nr:N-acetylmuramoyl-L-alanine amidase [Anaeromyxobacteraceae bacterium]